MMPVSKLSMLDLAGEQEDTRSPFLFQQDDDYTKLYVAIRQPTLELLDGNGAAVHLVDRKAKTRPVRSSSQPLFGISHTPSPSIDINCNPGRVKRPSACGQPMLLSGLPEVSPDFSRNLYRTADRIAKNAVKKAQVGKERARRSPVTAYPMERRSSSDSVQRSRAILRVSSVPDAWHAPTKPAASSSKKEATAHDGVTSQTRLSNATNNSRIQGSTASSSVIGDLSMADASSIIADGDLSMLDVEEPLTPTDASFIRSASSSTEVSKGDQSSMAHRTTPSRWTPTQPHIMEATSTQRTRPSLSRAVSIGDKSASSGASFASRHEAAAAGDVPEIPAVTGKRSPTVGRARLGMTRRVVAAATPAISKSTTSSGARHSPVNGGTSAKALATKPMAQGTKTTYVSASAQPTRAAPPPAARLPTPDDTPPDSGAQADSSFEYDAPSWDAEDWDVLMQPHLSQ